MEQVGQVSGRRWRVFPHAGEGWIALTLLPFKMYVIAAAPMCAIFANLISVRVYGGGWSSESVVMGVYGGYFLCVLALLLGSLVQAHASHRGAATKTLMYVGYCFVLLFFLLNRH